MKVLTIVYDLWLGGTQRNAQNFSLGFKERGHDVAVLSYQDGGPRLHQLESKGIPVFVGGTEKKKFAEAVEMAVSWCPDILHIHSHGREQPEIFDIIKRLRASVNHHLPIIERNVFAVPSSYVQWGCRTNGIYPKPMCVAGSNISETSNFYKPSNAARIAFRVSNNIPLDAFVFGRIGQPLHLKWSPIIFDAFREVAQKEKKAYLLLVGLPSELRSYLERLPGEIRKRIIEIPFIYGDEALRACYGAIDLFIHASEIGENCGNVLNESMLCECPVITLSTPYSNNSQVEQIIHNECGFIVGRVQDFAQAMLTLMKDELLRERFAKEGRRSVLIRYSMDSVMNALLRVIEITIVSSNREDLSARLQKENGLVTNVGIKEILALYNNAFGRTSALISMLLRLRLLRSPSVQKVWPRLVRKAFMMGI
ncbi:MAG: glycosyltransferase family 4 protein [Deltaproteobacteria bacterium]|nr:glycosyltransferase family 4 protein [Deltaproteobacteria bacterium]